MKTLNEEEIEWRGRNWMGEEMGEEIEMSPEIKEAHDSITFLVIFRSSWNEQTRNVNNRLLS